MYIEHACNKIISIQHLATIQQETPPVGISAAFPGATERLAIELAGAAYPAEPTGIGHARLSIRHWSSILIAEHIAPSEVEHTPSSEAEHIASSEVEHTPSSEVEHTRPFAVEHTRHTEAEHTLPSEAERMPSEAEHTLHTEAERMSLAQHTQWSEVRTSSEVQVAPKAAMVQPRLLPLQPLLVLVLVLTSSF